ncbi:ChbG/HpnK family deacetylase [Polaromonas sp. UC242_47]|uniref:ChbG/HpnK family deacetylase n=1 Tax=Polaromonas sp. UC242_47 TaxID=3374626 RepID=UPI0037999D1D
MDEFFNHDGPEHSRPRPLCLCVDDFGLHEGINTAALQLAEMARVHAIGCMVGAPAWKAGHAGAHRLDASTVDLGLHLDLTEYPLLSHTRKTVARWILDSYLGRLDRTMVRAEIRMQLDAFESAMGRPPAFIDGHQHVHQFPGVRDELLEELTGRYGSFRPWIRSTRAASPMGPNLHGGWRGLAKSRVIAHLGASGMALLASRGHYPQNRHLLGAYDFQTSPDRYRAMLLASLKVCEEGDLLMCHPSAQLQLADPIHAARKMEFEVLGSSAFAQWLTDAGIELRAMSSILGH